MPSTPFDAAHQDSLRMLIGKVLPGAGAHLIAEAVAAGYGFATHEAFGEAIRAVEAGQPAPAHDFDAERLIGRLHALGEPVGEQDEALRFLLGVMADGPRHGPPPEREAPDGPLAQQRLRTGRLYMRVGLWEHAGSILGTAMSVAPAELKGEVAAALEQAAPHAETAAANLAMALLSADGVTCDAAQAASLLAPPSPRRMSPICARTRTTGLGTSPRDGWAACPTPRRRCPTSSRQPGSGTARRRSTPASCTTRAEGCRPLPARPARFAAAARNSATRRR